MSKGPRHRLTRRDLLIVTAGGAAAAAVGARSARSASNGITTFVSPGLERWATPLPIPPRDAAGGELVAAPGTHRFHPDLPPDRTWGFDGQPYLGPTLEAHENDGAVVDVTNRLGPHRFGRDIDTTVHGAADVDRTRPRIALHLHGAPTEPGSDGHPLATIRPGGARRHRYSNHQEAATLWYHDHAMGITRLNTYAGLAGMYLVRDRYDSGRRDNPLGLPSGAQEVPLVLQDKMFDRDGRLFARTSTYVAEGQWEGGQAGDTPVVNGAAWPQLDVVRGLYRFRVLNASNLRTYGLQFSNAMAFWVIGNDAGLLDRSREMTYARIAPSERLDLLVDFSRLAPGETVVLRNAARLPFQFVIFGDPEIHELMRFRALRSVGRRRAVPERLRGGRRRPPALARWDTPARTRTMTVAQLGDLRFPPALMNLNNLEFDTQDTEDVAPGTVERWDLVNLTSDEHPIHLHVAILRVLQRRPFDVAAYNLRHPRPLLGVRWAPPADGTFNGPATGPGPWETGNKDTVYAPTGHVTSILVRWPSLDELGFDPDAPFFVPATIDEGAPGIDQPVGPSAVCRLSAATQPAPDRARGYVWHCHVLDHEDHEMMLPLRIRS